MEEMKKVCSFCGEVIEENDSLITMHRGFSNERYYHAHCVKENPDRFKECDDCGCWIDTYLDDEGTHFFQDYFTDGDKLLCSSCFFDSYDICNDCGDYIPQDETRWGYHYGEEVTVCASCADDYTECAHCNAYHHEDDITYIQDEDVYVCDECRDDNYFECADCGNWFNNVQWHEGDLCDACAGEIGADLDSVPYDNELRGYDFPPEISIAGVDYEILKDGEKPYWFQPYERENYSHEKRMAELNDKGIRCGGVNYVTPPTQEQYNTILDLYKTKLFEWEQESFMQRKNYKTVWNKNDADSDVNYYHHTSNNNRFVCYADDEPPYEITVGFELEFEHSDEWKRKDIAEQIQKICSDNWKYNFINFQTDGSVQYGFEIVSNTFSVPWFNKFYDEHFLGTLNFMFDEHCVSNNAPSSCGLHWHINKSCFGYSHLKQMFKFWWIFNAFPNFWIPVSRRHNKDWGSYDSIACQRLLKQAGSSEKLAQWCDEISEYELMSRLKSSITSRYRAVNLQNDKTIEVRAFKGTVAPDDFWTSYLLIVSAVFVSEFVDIQDLFEHSFDDYWLFEQVMVAGQGNIWSKQHKEMLRRYLLKLEAAKDPQDFEWITGAINKLQEIKEAM